MKKFWKMIVVFGLVVCLGGLSGASELMDSAKQLGIGRVAGVAYVTVATKEIDFGEYGEYDFIQAAYAAKLSVKVWEGWHAYVRAGKFTPEIEKVVSGATTKYENKDDFNGSVFGGGVKWVMFPDTLVSPAVTVDLGITQWSADFNKFSNLGLPAGITINANSGIDATEIQGAVMVSKKLLMFDPYAGLRAMSTKVKWQTTVDIGSQTFVDKELEGDGDGVSPFVGVKFTFLPLVSVVVEGSFVQETNISAGVRVGF